MKVYFDTNVLIAALKTDHIHHTRSYAAAEQVSGGPLEGYTSAHALIEFYSVATRTPFTHPIYPDEVLPLLERSVLPNFHIIDVTLSSHLAAIAVCAKAGWRGGRIHDAVHIQAALQAKCDLIYTWNLAEFLAIAPDLADKIQTPPNPARQT